MEKRERDKNEARVTELMTEVINAEMGDVEPVSITREELYGLAWRDRVKRRNRRMKYFSIAAAFVFIFGAVVYFAWPTIFPSVDADRNKQEIVEHKDNQVIINEGNEEPEEIDESQKITKWSEVESYHKDHPELCIPNSIPKGYTFRKLIIDSEKVEYRFINHKQQEFLIIQREKNLSNFIEENEKAIIVGSKKVYFVKNKQESTARFLLKNQIITVMYPEGMTKEDVFTIVKGIE